MTIRDWINEFLDAFIEDSKTILKMWICVSYSYRKITNTLTGSVRKHEYISKRQHYAFKSW